MDQNAECYDFHRIECDAERFELNDSFLANKKYLFLVAEHVDGGVCGPNPMPGESKAANKWPASTLLSGRSHDGGNLNQILSLDKKPQSLLWLTIYFHGRQQGWSYSLATNHVDLYGILPCSPEVAKEQCCISECFQVTLKVDRPVRSNYIKDNNDGGKITCCWAAMGCILFTPPAVADTNTLSIYPRNAILDSYQQ